MILGSSKEPHEHEEEHKKTVGAVRRKASKPIKLYVDKAKKLRTTTGTYQQKRCFLTDAGVVM